MISPELIRRFPFFAGLDHEYIVALADVAKEVDVEAGHIFFHENEKLCCFYITLQGAMAIVLELPDTAVEQSVAGQLTGDIQTKDVVITSMGPGEVFGWSALIPPHETTASAKALTAGSVLAFDCTKLLPEFERDCRFGYLMLQKAAQVIRERMRDMRIESLAQNLA